MNAVIGGVGRWGEGGEREKGGVGPVPPACGACQPLPLCAPFV